MGYCISVNSDNFSFEVEKGNEVLKAVKEGIENKIITEDRWISHSCILAAESVEELFEELRFDIKEKDNKYIVDFYGEKFGGYEESVFKVMAKFIDDGYLEYIGEDSEKWRYIFKDGQCKEVYPKIVWEDDSTKKVNISLDGCDDSTYIEMNLNDSELKFLEKLSIQSKENSTYGCMPTLEFEIEEKE